MSGEPPMILLIAAAMGGGLVTAAILAPLSPLAALITAPFVASAMAVLACLLIGWRSARNSQAMPVLDAQTDARVATLREVAQQAQTTPSRASIIRHKVA